ncbi:hypothetical protein N656DRAFT_782248 [Canariomyces notabilis]|uniref:Uncharacterized protein n=1 Tax=Canariomyces notabilis TaxID=2074819 RepID=A0AAN6TAQ5_9PEZI|nr:hypothetical protein N656DRAFT_782248 [Canariomyces arenarius]
MPPVQFLQMRAAAQDPARLQEKPGQHSGQPSPRVVRLPSTPSITPTDTTRGDARRLWKPREYHKWESPFLTVAFFIVGLAFSMAHCGFYASLDGTIVGNPADQENNLIVGTALAFLSQITLSASVWQTYKQWIWRSIKKVPLRMATLNDIFGVETSVLSFLNLDMFRNFKLGYIMALFAWTLILPPFFTPGTLFVYSSLKEDVVSKQVPYLNIANGSEGHYYAFSPSEKGDRFNFKNVLSRVFNGPRTILTLLSTATASQGEILPLRPPSNHSAYTLSFFGPAVQCTQANSSVEAIISELLARKMNETSVGTLVEVQNAYFSFVPSFDSQGNVTALWDVRYQSPSVASNEVWMAFERYGNSTGGSCDHDKYFQVCDLWNATYDLSLAWENGFQNITGSRELLHRVEYPADEPGQVSNMAQHAFSAFFWVISDQVVGSFGWFQETTANDSEPRYFGEIHSPIQHNALLGSSDLAVFFDYNEDREACQVPYANLSAQRRQDIDLAKNRTLGELIEELSFNTTVSLMHNNIYTNATTRLVTVWEKVNRYGYNQTGLWIPYALSCAFTLITVIIGVLVHIKHVVIGHEVMPGTKFQDILSAADMQVITIARDPDSRGRSLMVDFQGGIPTFRSPAVT